MVHIYTDASKTTDNKTSAAFSVPDSNIEHSVRLCDDITIFATELYAIKLALLWVNSHSDKNVVIFSDSYIHSFIHSFIIFFNKKLTNATNYNIRE